MAGADTVDPIVAEPFEGLVERLGREVDEGLFHTAVQLAVDLGGDRVLDVALGRTHLHEPFRSDTLSALYCTAKPLVAVAVLVLVAEDELSLEDQLGHILDPLAGTWMSALTVEQVLGHTAGLHTLNTVLARILPESAREQWIHLMPPPPGWRAGLDRAYAEFGGWFLLGQVIEELTGEPFDRFVTRRVIEPWGVDPDDLVMRFDRGTFDRLRSRLSAGYDLTLHQPIPLLAEVGRETACEWNPAFGAYGTMGAMATVYDGMLADLDGAAVVLPAELLAEATTARLPLTDDPTLGRPAGFGLGFMTPLSSHFFGDRPSQRAFGQTAQGGTSLAMADPERGLSVAVLFNAGLDADTALTYRRVNFFDALYRAVDELG